MLYSGWSWSSSKKIQNLQNEFLQYINHKETGNHPVFALDFT